MPRVYAMVKQAGQRKSKLAKKEMNISKGPFTLRTLIAEIVGICVDQYNNRHSDADLLRFFVPEEIESRAADGKVGFGALSAGDKVDLEKAVANALLSFEDGLYRVYIGDDECAQLSQNLDVQDGDTLTFIRFTMLAGRMW